MKPATAGLIALLNSGSKFVMADLYSITLNSGSILRYTSADIALKDNSGNNFLRGPKLARGKTRTVIGVEVDTLDVTINAESTDLIGTAPFAAAAMGGALDGAGFKLERWFAPQWPQQRRNLLIQTEQFGTSPWALNAASITANADPAPPPFAGQVTADRLVESATNAEHTVTQPFSYPGSQPFTFSVFIKSISSPWLFLQLDRDSGSRAVAFNAVTGAIGTIFGTVTATSEAVGNGWFRLSITGTPPATAAGPTIFLSHDGTSSSYLGNGSNALAIFGAQLEQGPLTGYQAVVDATEFTGTVPVGTLNMFQGRVSEVNGSRTQIIVKVKSLLELLDTKLPKNLFQPSCSRNLYDSGCSVSKAAFTTSATVVSAASGTTFNIGGAQAAGYYEQGVITFTSGANSGQFRTVKTFDSSHNVTVTLPFTNVPAPGDAFTIYPGCDKTQASCSGKFNNVIIDTSSGSPVTVYNRFRGFPFVPLPEAAYMTLPAPGSSPVSGSSAGPFTVTSVASATVFDVHINGPNPPPAFHALVAQRNQAGGATLLWSSGGNKTTTSIGYSMIPSGSPAILAVTITINAPPATTGVITVGDQFLFFPNGTAVPLPSGSVQQPSTEGTGG